MNHSLRKLVGRSLALFVALLLSVPHPALALRDQQPKEAGLEELEDSLRNSQPTVIQVAQLSPAAQPGPPFAASVPSPIPAAGLEEVKAAIRTRRLMAVIPVPSAERAVRIGRIVAQHGIIPEITFRGQEEEVVKAIEALSRELGTSGIPVAAGTVLNADQVEKAVEAGARIIVSPGMFPEVILRSKELGAVAIPAVRDINEARRAQQLGADFLKVFPTLGGEDFEGKVREPLPPKLNQIFSQRVRLVPSSAAGWDMRELATFTKIYEQLLTGTGIKAFAIPDTGGLELIQEIARSAPGIGLIPTGHGSVEYIPLLLGQGKNVVATGLSVSGTDEEAQEKADRMVRALPPAPVQPAAGLEEGVMRRQFLAGVSAASVGVLFDGGVVQGTSQLADNEDFLHLNIEQRRKQTLKIDLTQADPTAVESINQIFVHRDATVPSWLQGEGIARVDLSTDPVVAEEQLRQAQKGAVALIDPAVVQESPDTWNDLLLRSGIPGILTSSEILAHLEGLKNPAEQALFLDGVYRLGGLILEVEIRARDRALFISA